MLVVVSGLPGTGKSAVAAALARRLAAVHVSVDPIEDALLGAGLPPSGETGVAAYEAARAVAEQNLAVGRTVIVDAVNDSEPARDTWRRTGVDPMFVLLALDDDAEHRRRLEQRVRDLSHVPEPSWDDVRARAAAYAPWPGGQLSAPRRRPARGRPRLRDHRIRARDTRRHAGRAGTNPMITAGSAYTSSGGSSWTRTCSGAFFALRTPCTSASAWARSRPRARGTRTR